MTLVIRGVQAANCGISLERKCNLYLGLWVIYPNRVHIKIRVDITERPKIPYSRSFCPCRLAGHWYTSKHEIKAVF